MGRTLYISYYPKECNSPRVIPFLKEDINDLYFNGKHMLNDFYVACEEYGEKDEENECYIFKYEKLFTFAAASFVPDIMCDYIIQPWKYDSSFENGIPEDGIFIIWLR